MLSFIRRLKRSLKIKSRLRNARDQFIHLSGNTLGFPALPYYCPVCGKRVHHWRNFTREVDRGVVQEEEGGRLCPHCNSLERMRLFALYIDQTKILENTPRFLHMAPDNGLEKRLRKTLGKRYSTMDLYQANVDYREDIRKMNFEEGSFDYIHCSHVLEHIDDDAAAMAEMNRILSPGGTAYVQVPLRGDTTYEDFSITDPAQRYQHFGQADHVRIYGMDIIQRLEAAKFQVERLDFPHCLNLSPEEVKRMNLGNPDYAFVCTKLH